MVVADSPVALDSASLQAPAKGTIVMAGALRVSFQCLGMVSRWSRTMQDRRSLMRLTKLVVVVGLALAGCGGPDEPVIDPGDGGQYSVTLDPADFVADIDNPWMPFTPGHRWLYRVEGAADRGGGDSPDPNDPGDHRDSRSGH